jgi:hypothetical protein
LGRWASGADGGAEGYVFKLLSFLLLLVLMATALHQALSHGLRSVKTSQFGAFNHVMSGAVNADIVINGSSRAMAHYDPRAIERVTGASVFNLGRNASQSDMQLAILKAYLRRNAAPRLVVQNLDLSSLVVTHRGDVYEPGFYIPYLYDDDLYGALREIEPGAWKWKYIPLYGYTVEDLRFTWATGLKGLFGWNPPEDYIRGFNPRWNEWSDDFARFKAANPNGIHIQIEPEGIRALEGVIELCRARGIRLILVYSPEYSDMQRLTTNRPEIFAAFRALAERHSVRLLDFSDWEHSTEQQYFQNSQHLNARGAALFSTLFATHLTTPAHETEAPSAPPNISLP